MQERVPFLYPRHAPSADVEPRYEAFSRQRVSRHKDGTAVRRQCYGSANDLEIHASRTVSGCFHLTSRAIVLGGYITKAGLVFSGSRCIA